MDHQAGHKRPAGSPVGNPTPAQIFDHGGQPYSNDQKRPRAHRTSRNPGGNGICTIFEPNNAGARKPKRRANSARLSPEGKLKLALPAAAGLRTDVRTALRGTRVDRAPVFDEGALLMAADS